MTTSSSRRAVLLLLRVAGVSALLLPSASFAQAPAREPSQPSPPAAAQEQGHRPKIGLALSGGGARGVTHIGVLRALERMRIPVDYIAGTSMGAVVGGIYATGASTEDLEALVRTTDWAEVFTDRPARKNLPFRQKEDDRRYVVGFNLGLDTKGLHLTKGLVNGQKFVYLLETSTLTASGIQRFDDLPIPFRCVATDLLTGNRVVFSDGSLPMAIRASMSMPAIFSPVERNGLLLVDGGIADNLPVDVVRAMGAEVVIAVDIGTPPMDREQITSPVAVSSQVINILMQKEIDRQAADATVLLRPDLGRFSNMDFKGALKLIPVGEQLVAQNAQALARYAVSPEEYEARSARIRGLPAPPDRLDFVEFSGMNRADQTLLGAKLKTRPGQPLNLDTLQQDLVLLYNTGNYAEVHYALVQRNDQRGVVISARPSQLGPNTMRFGLELSSDYRHNSNWAVLAGLRFTRLDALGAEWKSDLELGLNQRLHTEFYQPLEAGERFFVAPYAKYVNELDYVFLNARASDPSASYRTSVGGAGIDLGIHFGRSGELRIGPLWGRASFSRAVGVDVFPNFHASVGGYHLEYQYDRLDSADLPTRGEYILLSAYDSETGLGATSGYKKGELRVKAYQPMGERSGGFEWFSAGTSFGSEVPYYDWFRLGGPYSFAGFMEGELVGAYYGAVRLGYQYEFATLPAIVGKGAYVMVYADAGNTWALARQIGWQGLKYSGTVGFGSSTKFGPVFLGFSFATQRNQQVFLSIGKRW